jgi:aminoglycoside 6'-N-acetyltransferase
LRLDTESKTMSAYHFRPFTCADLPMVARWLGIPEALRWWGDPKEQIDLITEDLDEPLIRQWIVEHDGRAFAYVQAYPRNAWDQTHLTHLPNGAVIIDAFIGEPAMLACGHGSGSCTWSKLPAEGAPIVASDPDWDNHRARRAYKRAGFVEESIVETGNGPVVVMLMSQLALWGCAGGGPGARLAPRFNKCDTGVAPVIWYLHWTATPNSHILILALFMSTSRLEPNLTVPPSPNAAYL